MPTREATIDAAENNLTMATRAQLLPCEVRGLSYCVGERCLIDGVDLTIVQSGITVVMGANGAGKSLLLRLLHGLLLPSAGEIQWGGMRLTEATRQRQAMVFQRPVLLRRSVAANVRFALKLRSATTDERIAAVLADVGLTAQADQPARLLSGGEQQRLSLARALALQPEVLLLDEPTASLDPTATAAIEDIVRTAHQRGTKIVFVTHDVGQARRLGDDVVFLDRGRLAEHTPAGSFFNNPVSAAARHYLAGSLILP